MKNDALRGAIVWFLIVLIISLFTAATISAYDPEADDVPAVHNSDTPKYEVEQKKEKTFKESLFTDPTAFFTMVLAIFTMVLAGVIIALWQEGRRAGAEQARLTRESLWHADRSAKAAEQAVANANISSENQLRAYVHLVDITYDFVMDHIIENNIIGYVFYTTWRNCGQTPAKNVNMWIAAASSVEDNNPVFKRDKNGSPSGANVGPNVICHSPRTNVFTMSHIKNNRVSIVAEMSYTDIFGKDNIDVICFDVRILIEPKTFFDRTRPMDKIFGFPARGEYTVEYKE